MKKFLALSLFWVFANVVSAQSDSTIHISLDQYSKDERFDRYQLTLALFLTQGDSILSMDYEGTRKTEIIQIKRPAGYKDYAYGYLFFSGTENKYNPGYVTVLVCNPYHKHPHMFLDYNQNFDFTDDPRFTLPYFDEKGVEFELANGKLNEGRINVVLTRNKLFGQKYDFKTYMDEYYELAYKGRKFIGIEYTYREQRYIVRSGNVKLNNESFRIGLMDVNSNGIYTDPGIDKIMFVNSNDTVFDATNPLNFVVFQPKNKPNFFEKNDKIYEVIKADEAGKYIDIKISHEEVDFNKIKTGRKAPKVKFTLVKGEILKLAKLRRKEVYMYYGSTTSKNFKSDTMMLRQIAALDTNNLKVICVLFVNKSYALRIYNSDAKPNYYLAYGTRELSKKMGINSVPQSLWLGKRRRVKQYGLSPTEFMRVYLQQKK